MLSLGVSSDDARGKGLHHTEEGVIVIDNGTEIIKAGSSLNAEPHMIPNIIGRTKYSDALFKNRLHEIRVGDEVLENRGMLNLKHPMKLGGIVDWDDMETMWNYVYEKKLKISSEEYPLLITQAPLTSTKNKEKLAEILFEKFRVPYLYVSPQAPLALLAYGKLTGTVLDIGDCVTQVVPVVDGYMISTGLQKEDYGGRNVTEYLRLLLRDSGVRFYSSSDFEIVREIKESCCYLREDQEVDDSRNNCEPYIYILPDNSKLKIYEERFQAPELLFNPDTIGLEAPGIHFLLKKSICSTRIDIQSVLNRNIVISGGSTLFSGFANRLIKEFSSIVAEGVKFNIHVGYPIRRQQATWIGGTIISSLGSFKDMTISAESYAENHGALFRCYGDNLNLDSI